jgi:hypothetical protein
MNFTVSAKEYMDLLALKHCVGAVVKTYRQQRQFIGTPGCDSLIKALEASCGQMEAGNDNVAGNGDCGNAAGAVTAGGSDERTGI